jgi:glycosyltransferase involved in cell wall biosynthesis
MLLSICIPTFERIKLLKNCYNSTYTVKKNTNLKFEVCISDNYSSQDIKKVMNYYRKKFFLKYYDFIIDINKSKVKIRNN